MKTSGICVSSFTKTYGEKEACSSVDFTAAFSEITGILGPNGAGKSTLIKAIAAFHYPTSGSVQVCGQTDAAKIRKITGYSPEEVSFKGNLTVYETLLEECFLRGIKKGEADALCRKAAEFTDITDLMNSKAEGLSKGCKKRLSISQAVCFNPEVLILDEFSEGLDPRQSSLIKDSIKKYAQNSTVLISTHRMEEALHLCTKIYIMNRGRIVYFGSPQAALETTGTKNLEEAFLRLTENE
ncbi:MAG: ABC transporter ATP-binding protein [Treponema sp.]|nr:ABC transporter ATP-binding protein [Treponema sp.]